MSQFCAVLRTGLDPEYKCLFKREQKKQRTEGEREKEGREAGRPPEVK